MLGTGESASSSSESTTPSTISSSRTGGTYWFDFGSPTSLICSSAAGVMRTWNASNAGRSASTSITSWPNFSASFSRESTLPSRRTFCHSLMASLLAGANRQQLRENHPVIVHCIKPAHACTFHVSDARVEVTRLLVRCAGGRFRHAQPRPAPLQERLHRAHERAPVAATLRARIHGDPVQLVAAIRAGRRPPARIALARALGIENAHELIGLRRPHSLVEQLARDVDLRWCESARRFEDLDDALAVMRCERANEPGGAPGVGDAVQRCPTANSSSTGLSPCTATPECRCARAQRSSVDGRSRSNARSQIVRTSSP